MDFLKLSIFFTLSLTFTGCVSTEIIKYPNLNTKQTISISNQQISAWNEAGVGDYLIKDSQIIIGDASNISSNNITPLFGLIGLGITTVVDKNNNKNLINDSFLNKAIKFDKLVSEKFKSNIESGKLNATLLEEGQTSDITITPFSRLSFKNSPIVTAKFTYLVRFTDPKTQRKQKKTYTYFSKEKSSLNYWEANNNELFINNTNQAFDILTKVLILDMQNKLDVKKIKSSQQEKCKNEFTTSTTVFIESPENLCIGVILFQNKIFPNNIFITQ